MESTAVGLVSVVVLLSMLAMGMNVGIAMALVGFVGTIYLVNFNAALGILGMVPYSTMASYDLVVIPLFVLMGHFASISGLTSEMFQGINVILGRVKGSLAHSAILSGAGFAAICGSSLATTATMGTVILPEMRKQRYEDGFASGCVVAGGSLGILIPPSVVLILYGAITGQSIGKLFVAGILPGIILTLLYLMTNYLFILFRPGCALDGRPTGMQEKLKAVRSLTGIFILIVIMLGGLFAGLFTAIESAAVGAFGAMIFLLFRKKLTSQNIYRSLLETGKTTSMIFLIIIGGKIFSYFLGVSKIPTTLAAYLSSIEVSPLLILAGMYILYMILGCFMDALAMMMLTVPIFYPVILSLGFDPIWFGVVQVLIQEQAFITPPVGMNVYVLKTVAEDIPIEKIFKGSIPYLAAIVVLLIMITAYPELATFLPGRMK